ncbi:hypothetical protein CVO77_00225 [Sphingopyxis lindanitolerans]|uniref:N-acetyltransferase n=1 Tax=Sphingopyxis lindanitolerans TaxID=2054227 RepID=A0A2S8BAG4_9SPHN|nr:hypothetical protein [Sphingopyxis lindanitolerans]PQM29401.1 hypothetical protein CVO77_00225 [Sphingopyxis lindanitolerans]
MRLVEAEPAHIPFLAENMRPSDVAECAAFGRDPSDALANALTISLWALTAIVDDQPHAMMGVASRSMIEGVGIPWMLGTERVYDHGRDLVRHAPVVLAEMHATFPQLENLVSADNARALRFLRHVGFEICEAPINVSGTAFLHFHRGGPSHL